MNTLRNYNPCACLAFKSVYKYIRGMGSVRADGCLRTVPSAGWMGLSFNNLLFAEVDENVLLVDERFRESLPIGI